MSRSKEIVTAAGTLACALGVGFFMQNTDTAVKRYSAPKEKQTVAAASIADTQLFELAEDMFTTPPVDVRDVVLTSALSDADALQSQADTMPNRKQKDAGLLASPEGRIDQATVPDLACDIIASATPSEAAFVDLQVKASCFANEWVTVHHNGMMFSDQMDMTGAFNVTVPALSENATFIFEFKSGDGAVAQTMVSDLKGYNRVALQWSGHSGFELHAREFGAEYGATGHIWRGTEQKTDAFLAGSGGQIVQLGNRLADKPLMVEVYTFPAAMSGRNGQIDLSVEAAVTELNCGHGIQAQTIELTDAGTLKTQQLTLEVPECDGVGDYLVLNNVLEGMKIAAR